MLKEKKLLHGTISRLGDVLYSTYLHFETLLLGAQIYNFCHVS